jgi:hypothetical protein
MPVLVRWYLKTALVYFVASLVLGVVQASAGPFAFLSSSLTPVYYHLLMVGWITQLILGIAIWMFPKFSLAQPRGNEGFAWGAYFLLNLGLLIRVISEPVNALYPTATWGLFLVVSAVLQWLAGMLIVANIWQRVKVK